ncbi:MAG: transcription antitermination factor NusB [Terracidiphilus sp.]|jgi:16S rRNA (cytosine967-C5)-methyltransferase
MTAPKNRTAEISPARKVAFHILLAVERGHSHSDDLLRGKTVDALSAADRNLATALVLGVLRWQILLDRQIQTLLARPNAKLDPEIHIALRLGAFQMLRMDRIPTHAAIDESVELAKQAGHHFASAMVNAVLRKLAKTLQSEEERLALKGHDSSRTANAVVSAGALQAAEKLDCRPALCQGTTSVVPQMPLINARALAPEGNPSDDLKVHPAWLIERWITFYGLKAARAICRHGQSQPVLTVRLASPAIEAELVEHGVVLEAGELLTAARTVISGDVTTTPAFREGSMRLQDEGSQLVAELACGNLGQKVECILDVCAAPGGKTLILAERHPTARIVAMECSAPRLAQLRKRLAFLGERVECRQADATALTEDSVFDRALADVPCSGTGTLGRNPEIRHRLRPEDLTRQAERQRAIFAAALRAVRPGGRVVYSTCSLEPEENEQVIAELLAASPHTRLLPLADCIEALRKEDILTLNGAERLQASLTPEGCLRLLPGAFHTDGLFIAMIERAM